MMVQRQVKWMLPGTESNTWISQPSSIGFCRKTMTMDLVNLFSPKLETAVKCLSSEAVMGNTHLCHELAIAKKSKFYKKNQTLG